MQTGGFYGGSSGGGFSQQQQGFCGWQSMNFVSEDEFGGIFRQYSSPSLGGVQAEELARILNEHPRIRDYYRINWSLELCKIMIAMLDRSRDGVMQYNEFKELLNCLVYWFQVFREHDKNQNGFIDAFELHGIIRNRFQYNLSEQAMNTILKRYSKQMDNRQCIVAFDDFVALAVRLRSYTEAFRARDQSQHGRDTGTYQFTYDDFLQCTMCL